MFPQPQRTPDLLRVKMHVFKQASVKTDAITAASSNSILQCENNRAVGVVLVLFALLHSKTQPY